MDFSFKKKKLMSLQHQDFCNMGVSINGGTPSYHPFWIGVFPYKPPSWGYPHLRNPPMDFSFKKTTTTYHDECYIRLSWTMVKDTSDCHRAFLVFIHVQFLTRTSYIVWPWLSAGWAPQPKPWQPIIRSEKTGRISIFGIFLGPFRNIL